MSRLILMVGVIVEHSSNLLLALVVSHVVIIIVQFAVKRFTILPKSSSSGIYLMLLPVGVNCFDSGIPGWFIAVGVLVGFGVVLWGLRRPREAPQVV